MKLAALKQLLHCIQVGIADLYPGEVNEVQHEKDRKLTLKCSKLYFVVSFRAEGWNPDWSHYSCDISRLEGNVQRPADIGHLCWRQDSTHTRWNNIPTEPCTGHQRYPWVVHTDILKPQSCETVVSLLHAEWSLGTLGLHEWRATWMQEDARWVHRRTGLE